MKKLLLSGGVLGLFLLYGWHQQQEAAEIKVTPPASSLPSDQSKPAAPDTSRTQGPQNQDQMQTTPSQNTQVQSQGQYKDGTYTGSVADAFYGNIQVQAVIHGGKIADVTFLQYPNDRRESIMINEQAMPYLRQEAIQSQSANVDIVSGATDSSQAFQQSLQSALDQGR